MASPSVPLPPGWGWGLACVAVEEVAAWYKSDANVAGTPRARGRAFGDSTGSVWDFGFYFKHKNPRGGEIGEG